MPYEAVPIDVELQKVTAAERDALSRYKIHENINTFLANENVPTVIGGFIAGYFGVKLAEDIIADIESRVGKLSEDVKQGIKDTVDIKLPTFGAPAPVTPTISDLIAYIQRRVPGGNNSKPQSKGGRYDPQAYQP
jgi:hypothetical protein